MHCERGSLSALRPAWSLAWGILLLAGCNSSKPGKVPDFVARLPLLGAASSRHDSAMGVFERDLEAWAARAGRPSSAEALIGPMFLRNSRLHSLPSAADTGMEASYQRLEVRFAELLASGDSLSHAADTAREQLSEWAGRQAKPAGERTAEFRTPIFPPTPYDPGRGAVALLAAKCPVITVSVLPSKEGVSICVLKQKICTAMPADTWGDAWWAVACTNSCFDYIGWVPDGGGFTIGDK
jgi:hypothetical protein